MKPVDDEQTYEALLQSLSLELAALRVRAGNPSLRDIQKRAQKLFADEGVSLPPSTLSGLFNGGYPGRDRLLWLVRTLLSFDRSGQGCPPPDNGAPELDPWYDRWEAITRVRPTRRRHRLSSTAVIPAAKEARVHSSAATQSGVGESHDPVELRRSSGRPSARRQDTSSLNRSVVFVSDVSTGQVGYERALERVQAEWGSRRPGSVVRGSAWGQEGVRLSAPGGDAPAGTGSSTLIPLISRLRRRSGRPAETFAGSVVGDILRYQARGQALRQLIKQTIDDAPGDAVTVLAHGFGCVPSFDLLVQERVNRVDQFITVATQLPLLFESGALVSLQPQEALPDHFPQRWLNVYAANDVLAYSVAQVFPDVATDQEVDNGQRFPQTHSAYLTNPAFWRAVDTWVG